MNKSIYIILSKTQTRFAKLIRFFGKQEYSHASISLNDDFSHIYAFARPQHNAIFLGELVRESLIRFTQQKDFAVPVAVFKLSVSEQDYEWIKERIETMMNNPEYIYNLYSVLLYPITKGFAVKNAFTCVEFVTYLLQHSGYLQEKKRYHYTPDDIAAELYNDLLYKKDVRECLPDEDFDKNYFAPFTFGLFCLSIKRLYRVTMRTFFQRGE